MKFSLSLISLVLLCVCTHSVKNPLPKQEIGMYCLLADDTIPNYTSDDDWTPSLYNFQLNGANVVYFTFINPTHMKVPPAYIRLAKCRGSGGGCPTASQTIIFSVGGYSYSNNPNPWPFLTSVSAAEAMAAEVATWSTKYGADGIDLDIETGAGNAGGVGPNMVAFVRKLKQLNPSFIVTQPVFGYPQVTEENYLVNSGWTKNGVSNNLIDTAGIMVYNGLGSLQYVKNYVNATSQWQGFPIHVDVPSLSVLAGINGNAGSATISDMATQVLSQNLGGMMVWMSSVYDSTRQKPAFTYGGGANDASKTRTTTGAAWISALKRLQA